MCSDYLNTNPWVHFFSFWLPASVHDYTCQPRLTINTSPPEIGAKARFSVIQWLWTTVHCMPICRSIDVRLTHGRRQVTFENIKYHCFFFQRLAMFQPVSTHAILSVEVCIVCISEWGSATLYHVFSFIWGYTTQPYEGKGARVKNPLQIHWKYGMWCVCAFPEPNTVWLKDEFMKYALKICFINYVTNVNSFTSYFDVIRVTHRHFQSCLLHGGFAANEQSK